jgi:hypothetical protein
MSGYRVGVELALHGNGLRSALAAITAQMMGMHNQVNSINRGFLAANRNLQLMVGGAAGLIVGGGLLKGVLHVEKAAESLVHAETTLRAALPPANRLMDMRIAQTAAYAEAGNNLNTTLSDNIEHLHDLYNVVQDMHHAADLLPAFNKLSNAFSFVKDENIRNLGNDAAEIARAARAFELAGRTTADSMDKIVKSYVKAAIGLRGRVSPNMLLQAVQTAGAGRYGWSDEFLAQGLPALLNVMPSRAGNALYHMYNNLYGGVASSYAQGLLQEKWGLHTADQEVRDPIFHKFQGFKVGSVWGAELLASDPQKWALSYRDFLKNVKGVNTDSLEDMRKVVGEIGRGNKLLASLLDEYLLPNPSRQLLKERQNIERVGDDATGIMDEDDPRMWRKKLAAQWTNFEEAFGVSLVPAFIKNVLSPLTKALRDLSQAMLIHPNAAKLLGESITIAGVALTGLGGLAIAGAIGRMSGAFWALGRALRGVRWAAMAAVRGMGLIGGLMIGNPWLAIAAGLGLAAVAVYNHWDEIVAYTKSSIAKLTEAMAPAKKAFDEFMKPVDSLLSRAGQGLSNALGLNRTTWAEIVKMRSMGIEPTQSAMNSALLDEFLKRRREQATIRTLPERYGSGQEGGAGTVNKTETKTVTNTVNAPVSVTVNVANSSQAPAAVGQAVGGSVAASMRGAMADVAQ